MEKDFHNSTMNGSLTLNFCYSKILTLGNQTSNKLAVKAKIWGHQPYRAMQVGMCTKGLLAQKQILKDSNSQIHCQSCLKYVWQECIPRLHSQRSSVRDLFFLYELSSYKESTHTSRQKSKAFEFVSQLQHGPSSQPQYPVPQFVEMKKYSPKFCKKGRKAHQAHSGMPSSLPIQACWPVQESRNTSDFCQQT